jgi:hypothetical protein
MAERHPPAWVRSLDGQAMEVALYRTGHRAGTVAAAADWPHVAMDRPTILTKALQATQALFGREGVARNTGYYIGWVDGYLLRCRDLHRQR